MALIKRDCSAGREMKISNNWIRVTEFERIDLILRIIKWALIKTCRLNFADLIFADHERAYS